MNRFLMQTGLGMNYDSARSTIGDGPLLRAGIGNPSMLQAGPDGPSMFSI
jgi:hypothetical protein